MPLMVDVESGMLLVQGGPDAASYTTLTLNNAPSVSAGPTAYAHIAIGNPFAPNPTEGFSSGHNMSQVISAEAAQQFRLSRSMPMFFILALGGILLLCAFLSYNRFIARLLASTQKVPASQERAEKLNLESGGQARIIGGGDLKTGWRLSRGIKSTATFDTSATDPFADIPLAIPSKSAPTLLPPPHLPPLIHNLPFAPSLLFTPFSKFPLYLRSSVTLSRLYLATCYVVLLIVAITWKSNLGPTTPVSGYGRDFARTGNLAVAQIPIVIALGVKGNLVGLAIGVGYEKLKILHKLAGRMIFVCSTVHVGYFLFKWSRDGVLGQELGRTEMIYGSLGFWALCMIVISSLPVVRKMAHGVFKICHLIGIMGFLIGTAFHVPSAQPWCLAGVILYAISIVSSLTKTRLAHAELLTLPSSDMTGVFIPTLRTGWRPGQHVRLRVPALGLKLGWEAHPFTISSAPDGEGLVLLCKKSGDWTAALYDLASTGVVSADSEGNQRTVTVLVEGPYGGIGNTMLPSFSSVLLTAGGAGIAHALSVAHDLMNKAPSGCIRARTIDLVWIVPREEIARGILPTLLDLVNDAKAHETFCIEGYRKGKVVPQPTALRVHIFISRCPTSSPLALLSNPFLNLDDPESTPDSAVLFERANSIKSTGTRRDGAPGLKRQPTDAEKVMQSYLLRSASSSSTATTSSFGSTIDSHGVKKASSMTPLSCISAHPGRPEWSTMLDGLAEETIRRAMKTRTDASGICVTSCGPPMLVDGVRDAVRGLEGWKRRQVGGVDFEEEHFAF